ncbi:hypothetical protein SAMD00019534_008970 [Acytostelium subglobosum LB1]|uniref:hypothetical protein n=1 Tax=Acytostelium subglobosum LB1 TaxID=1410327 RepID=UPI000644C194|nr:hypothetical protein SAMD00019534_008970 [Acytostelium subglobosum LB1]GAM17722.1 hypothetical protein SAMD00019534_008970 [Acytostelium subglobosum LB1]|eukprot:XP_012758318.1 hypothetical protein SAMD00019534_008970 [Acytostelium subglobosum LB1]
MERSSAQTQSLEGSVPGWNNDMFSPELQAAINDIIPSQDPIDRYDFNPVKYINENFPTEQNLNHLDTFMARLRQKIAKIDEEIIQEIRLQSSTGAKGKEDLENAKRSINELLKKIADIKSKANKSEQMVTEICKDIKSLDYAKKNLTSAIKTLKQLHMMVMCVEQLKEGVKTKEYAKVAQLLEATADFAEGFKNYRDSPKIAALNSDLESIRTTVKDQIYTDFKNYIPSTSNVSRGDEDNRWRSACLVVDALGQEMKKDFLRWFCDIQLSTYKSSFTVDEEHSQLKNVKRRYKWLVRQLNQFKLEYAGVFPVTWKMEENIAYEFCCITKLALQDLLNRHRNDVDVNVLLNALNKTLEFEKQMYKAFAAASQQRDSQTPEPEPIQQQDDEEHEHEEEHEPEGEQNPHSIDAINERWIRRQKQLEQREQERNNPNSPAAGGRGPAGPNTPKQVDRTYERFLGILSSSFDPYMDLYINEEDKKMSEALTKLVSEEKWVLEAEATNKILSSGTDLIQYFRKALDRCSSLSKGEPFFNLYTLFTKYLRQYAQVLSSKVPSDFGKAHDEREDRIICLIINTAEYFSKTTTQIAEKFKKLIIERYKEKIDLTGEKSEYSMVITKSVKSLVEGIGARMEPHIQTMIKTDWGDKYQYVGDHSPYIDAIMNIIHESFKVEVELLTPFYFGYFCDKFAEMFIFKTTQSIYKCQRISEIGAQGLLLDISTLKKCLEGLPLKALGQPNNRYIRFVNTEFGKTEAILKVVGCPNEQLVETYNALIPEGSQVDLQKIVELKGIKAGDKTVMLEKYVTNVEKTLLTGFKKLIPVSSIFNNSPNNNNN